MSKQAELVGRARALAPLIRAHADESERERKLATPVVDALHDAGLFRMMLPESLGGSGLNAAEAAPILEEVACADGSAGWNLAIGAGNSAFLALLEDEAAIAELSASPRSLGAGSINPTSLRLTPAPGKTEERPRLLNPRASGRGGRRRCRRARRRCARAASGGGGPERSRRRESRRRPRARANRRSSACRARRERR